MKRTTGISMAAVLAAALAAPQAVAQAKTPPPDIAPKMQPCLACHVVDGRKTVGPPYKEVAQKYATQKDAQAYLVQRVIKGSEPGKLKWGQIPMPPNAVSEADANAMVKWIISLK